jgi:hypothetical protein
LKVGVHAQTVNATPVALPLERSLSRQTNLQDLQAKNLKPAPKFSLRSGLVAVHCKALQRIALQRIAQHSKAAHCTARHCSVKQRIAKQCTALFIVARQVRKAALLRRKRHLPSLSVGLVASRFRYCVKPELLTSKQHFCIATTRKTQQKFQ